MGILVVLSIAIGRDLIDSSAYSIVSFGTVIAYILLDVLLREKGTEPLNEKNLTIRNN